MKKLVKASPRPRKSVGLAVSLLSLTVPLGLAAVVMSSGTSQASGAGGWRTTVLQPSAAPETECGIASWYGGKFVGKLTANGEIYDPQTMTAAHKKLKFGTLVRVTQQGSGRSVVVRINNRGPFIEGRVIDLSEKAATLLAFKSNGLTKVCVSVLPR